jgi:hypothetical protein
MILHSSAPININEFFNSERHYMTNYILCSLFGLVVGLAIPTITAKVEKLFNYCFKPKEDTESPEITLEELIPADKSTPIKESSIPSQVLKRFNQIVTSDSWSTYPRHCMGIGYYKADAMLFQQTVEKLGYKTEIEMSSSNYWFVTFWVDDPSNTEEKALDSDIYNLFLRALKINQKFIQGFEACIPEGQKQLTENITAITAMNAEVIESLEKALNGQTTSVEDPHPQSPTADC